jgi:hypothetical protein
MLKRGNQDRICRGLQSVMDIGLSSIIKDLAGALKKLLSEMPKQSITTRPFPSPYERISILRSLILTLGKDICFHS